MKETLIILGVVIICAIIIALRFKFAFDKERRKNEQKRKH